MARRSIVAVYVRAILAVSAWAAAAPAYSQIAAYIRFFHDCIGPGCCDPNGSVTPFEVTGGPYDCGPTLSPDATRVAFTKNSRAPGRRG